MQQQNIQQEQQSIQQEPQSRQQEQHIAQQKQQTQRMRAAVVTTADGVFELQERARPSAQAGQVLVEIHASGVNPLDTKIRAGKADHARQPLPAVLGLDLAGVVVAVGAGVEGFAVGDEVFGMTGGVGGIQGSLAEYAAVDARLLAPKPRQLSMREAAALPLIFITAWEGLVDRAGVRFGQQVLVQGGSGGVGHMAVQIAIAHGAEVYATASARQQHRLAQLGAQPIDYSTQTVAEYVQTYSAGQGFDIVYDTVGGAVLEASFQAVKACRGHVVSCLGWGTHSLAPLSFRAATYSGVFTLLPLLTGQGRERHGAILRQAARLADKGQLHVWLDPQRFTLDNVAAAYDLQGSGQAQGKVVVEIR